MRYGCDGRALVVLFLKTGKTKLHWATKLVLCRREFLPSAVAGVMPVSRWNHFLRGWEASFAVDCGEGQLLCMSIGNPLLGLMASYAYIRVLLALTV